MIGETHKTTSPPIEALALDPLSPDIDLAVWQRLAEKASDPNPFFGPDFLIPFLKNMGRGQVKLIVVRHGHTGEWLIAAPLGKRRLGLAVPAATVWSTEYAPLGTPLMTGCTPREAVALFVDTMMQETGTPLAAIPYLPLDTAIAAQLLTLGSDWSWKLAHETERAGHAHGAKGETQFAEAYSGKRRKELKRLIRRLSEEGDVEFTSVTGEAAVEAFEAFLELETRGWKGKSGTALKSDPKTRAFSREMVARRSQSNGVRIDSLSVDGKPLAMLVLLQEGHQVYSWKIAYDEAYARYSPGSQLTLYAVQENLKNPGIWSADSLAIPGHPMIEPLWRGKVRIATLLMAKSSTGRLLMSAGQADTDLEQTAKSIARKLFRKSR